MRREEDLNPVYGFYYFANGQQIDDNNAEATDENQYYESWKLIFNTFEHFMIWQKQWPTTFLFQANIGNQ